MKRGTRIVRIKKGTRERGGETQTRRLETLVRDSGGRQRCLLVPPQVYASPWKYSCGDRCCRHCGLGPFTLGSHLLRERQCLCTVDTDPAPEI